MTQEDESYHLSELNFINHGPVRVFGYIIDYYRKKGLEQ